MITESNLKKKNRKNVTVEDLVSLIPEDLLKDLSDSLKVDKSVKKLKGSVLFKLIFFSLLSSERLSLRLMEDNFQDPLFRALAPTLEVDKVGWTGIRDRLIHVKSDFFQQLYLRVYEMVIKDYSKKSLLNYNIKRYDSTMIATFSHLLEGMKVGNVSKGKTQVKLTTEFTNDFLITMKFFKDQAHLSEETSLKEVINEAEGHSVGKKSDIHVFDKGLKSRKTFSEFSADEISFVGRLSGNPRYEFQRPHTLVNDGDEWLDNDEIEFVEDSIVKLYEGGKTLSSNEFRLIQYKVKGSKKIKKESDRTLYFVTNVLTITAAEIAEVYKMRWDIEVLFRFLKQEMNLTHFVCNNENAIQVMLYSTMIASMLILIYKKQNNIKSYKRAKIKFFKEFLYAVLLDVMENPEEMEKLKKQLKRFVLME